MTQEEAQKFAEGWVAAWNAHDLDEVLSYYEDDFEMMSPIIASYAGEPSGMLKGKEAVEAYWIQALMMIPDLKLELIDVFPGIKSIIISYKAAFDRRAAELFEFGASGKVLRAVAHYTE